MKRKTKLAICSLRNSVGNVKRGSNTLWKKIINNKWNWSENQKKQGNLEKQEGVQSEVVVWYESAKEHNS